ncbi:hypothetical protein [Anderseniella sp. Alg231-50]|uniref:hypothetical protein n=1 Tax=Anderseniella sp. Alg231-50 TaxID=1922226 RepID=UPI00307C80A7
MAFPINLLACHIDPTSPECEESRRFLQELLETAYLSRILPRLKVPLPRPDPPPFAGDPHPQPNLSAIAGNHNVLIGELLINALNGPNLTAPLKEIKKSGLQKEVANKVLGQLKASVKLLEKEVSDLK